MPKSPKVATYDLQPEMSAAEVTERFVEAIEKGYDLIVGNYANPDMVGHTGDLEAAIKACEAVDQGLGRVLEALEKAGGAMIVTADHGNCETMVDPRPAAPHTSHTTNPVPVMLFGGPEGARCATAGCADLAPTLLELMGLEQPEGDDRPEPDRTHDPAPAPCRPGADAARRAGRRRRAAPADAARAAAARLAAARELLERGRGRARPGRGADRDRPRLRGRAGRPARRAAAGRDPQRAPSRRSSTPARTRCRSCWACCSRSSRAPAPLLLLHPAGPLGTARSGMIAVAT